MVEWTQADWVQLLRSAYNSTPGPNGEARDPRQIDWPEAIGVAQISPRAIRLKLTAKATCARMEDNESAFEVWSLAAHELLGSQLSFDTIDLDWDSPAEATLIDAKGRLTAEGAKYERFLYRAHLFRTLFPWFQASARCDPLIASCRALNTAGLHLNLSTDDRSDPGTPDPADTREVADERRFVTSSEFKTSFELDDVTYQFPVGVFAPDGHLIFPARGSRVDLVGVSKRTLFVFELKVKDNSKAGALSELLA